MFPHWVIKERNVEKGAPFNDQRILEIFRKKWLLIKNKLSS